MQAPTAPLRWANRVSRTCRFCGITGPPTRMKRMSTTPPLLAQKPKAKTASKASSQSPKPLAYSPSNKRPPPRPSLSPSPRQPSTSSSHPLRFRKLPLLLGGITAMAMAGYASYTYVSYKRAVAEGASLRVPADVSARYDDIAGTFDAEVEYAEWAMGLLKLRRKVAEEAEGDVCEVSIGTGRNMGFYDWGGMMGRGDGKGNWKGEGEGKIRSFTAVDKSVEMLGVAREKFAKEFPEVEGVRWVVQDAALPLPPPPPPGGANKGNGNGDGGSTRKYDTIIQTMGLCSTGDPVGLLRNLGASISPSGRIVLLEHGRGYWEWVNGVLDGLAPRHAERFGCWWNRDIGAIVAECGELEVVRVRRSNWGTTWWVELRLRGGEGGGGEGGEGSVMGEGK